MTSLEAEKKRIVRFGSDHLSAIHVFFILLLSLGIYWNAMSNGFVYDDADQVLANPWIRDARFLPEIFASNSWAYTGQAANYYRPMMHVAFMINFHLFGLSSAGFHAVNILIHSLNSVLVYFLVFIFLKRNDPGNEARHSFSAFLGALLFVAHPVHTEAVTWVSGIPELLFTFFGMVSFLFFLRSRGAGRGSHLRDTFFSGVAFFVATLCKETALCIPGLFVCYDLVFENENKDGKSFFRDYAVYFLFLLFYSALRIHALKGFAPVIRHAELIAFQYVINIFPLLMKYIGKIVIPLELNVFHSFHPYAGILDAGVIVSIVFLFILIVLADYSRRTCPAIFLGMAFLFLPLFPALYIPGLGENPFAERYLYFPSIGIILLLFLGVDILRGKRPAIAVPVMVACLLLAGAYSVGTIHRNKIWKGDYTLWEDAVRKSPDAPIPNHNFGLLLYGRGDVDEAIRYYKAALRLKPSGRVLTDLGLAYSAKGAVREAAGLYREAIRMDPNYPLAYNNLGVLMEKSNSLEDAIQLFRTAIRLSPGYLDAYNNLGYVYYRAGMKKEAMEYYNKALRLDPGNVNVQNNMALLNQ